MLNIRATWDQLRMPPRWPILYTLAVVAVMTLAFSLSIRREGIFSCPGNQYVEGYYLGYCQGRTYGDYDHGAFWFGLEPRARAAAAAADILFVGNSRMTFGFSAPALGKWGAAESLRYYLLGFSHTENVTFLEPLLSNLKPKARVYIINLDEFFVERATLPGNDVMRASDARERYVAKQIWQLSHRLVCSRLSFLCGKEIAYYRQPETGEWLLDGTRGYLVPGGTGPSLPIEQKTVEREKDIAIRFLAGLRAERRCIFMTYVPAAPNRRATAAALAELLGFEMIAPQIEGLRTFDGTHLDRDSAERFVSAFLEIGRSRFKQCLET